MTKQKTFEANNIDEVLKLLKSKKVKAYDLIFFNECRGVCFMKMPDICGVCRK